MLTKETKVEVRGDYRRSWMSDDYFDLSGEDSPEANRTPILLPGGSFPVTRVGQEFRRRSERMPKSLRNFVLAKLEQFAAKQKA
jgi:hypothetical protein